MSGEGKRSDWPSLKPPRPSSTLPNQGRSGAIESDGGGAAWSTKGIFGGPTRACRQLHYRGHADLLERMQSESLTPVSLDSKQPTSACGAPLWMKMVATCMRGYFHGRDSWFGQRKRRALCIEFVHGVADRPVQRVNVGKCLMCQVMRREVVPDHLMSLSSGAYLGSHSMVSQCARAASAAIESLLVWIGPLSSTSATGLVGWPAWDHRADRVARDGRRNRCCAWSDWCGR